jgi:hypothetical protein
MKRLLLFSAIISSSIFSKAQENSSAKNTSVSSETDKKCSSNHTATILINNKTSHDIYFYYTSHLNGLNVEYLTIKAGKTEINDAIYATQIAYQSKDGIKYSSIKYSWKASYDYIRIDKYRTSLDKIEGFDGSTFMLNDCEIKNIDVE